MPTPLTVRIVGTDLPGRTCGPSPQQPGGHHDIVVAPQRRARADELLDPVPADVDTAVWDLPCRLGDDGTDISGPWVQGRRGGRWIYLSWLHGADRVMFRRAKLGLEGLDPALLAEAAACGVLTGTIGLTDGRGNPRCASVGSALHWVAGTQPV